MICDECETVANCMKNGCVPKHQALERMAENARELGLDYEQPAQHEPVAWMEMVVANLVREGVNKHKARELAQHFYTSPPTLSLAHRPWVGLTDEEIVSVVSLAGFAPDWVEAHIAIQIVRVLEAKLKEKNT